MFFRENPHGKKPCFSLRICMGKLCFLRRLSHGKPCFLRRLSLGKPSFMTLENPIFLGMHLGKFISPEDLHGKPSFPMKLCMGKTFFPLRIHMGYPVFPRGYTYQTLLFREDLHGLEVFFYLKPMYFTRTQYVARKHAIPA